MRLLQYISKKCLIFFLVVLAVFNSSSEARQLLRCIIDRTMYNVNRKEYHRIGIALQSYCNAISMIRLTDLNERMLRDKSKKKKCCG